MTFGPAVATTPQEEQELTLSVSRHNLIWHAVDTLARIIRQRNAAVASLKDAETELQRLRNTVGLQARQLQEEKRVYRVACEGANDRMKERDEARQELATVREKLRTTHVELEETKLKLRDAQGKSYIVYDQTKGIPTVCEPDWEKKYRDTHVELVQARGVSNYLKGQVDGLKAAVNTLTASQKHLVESKNPTPKPHFSEVPRAFDQGWNAALDRLLNYPNGAHFTIYQLADVIRSLKKAIC